MSKAYRIDVDTLREFQISSHPYDYLPSYILVPIKQLDNLSLGLNYIAKGAKLCMLKSEIEKKQEYYFASRTPPKIREMAEFLTQEVYMMPKKGILQSADPTVLYVSLSIIISYWRLTVPRSTDLALRFWKDSRPDKTMLLPFIQKLIGFKSVGAQRKWAGALALGRPSELAAQNYTLEEDWISSIE